VRQVADSHNRIIGCHYRHRRKRNATCPILKICVNGVSMILGIPSWSITTQCSHYGLNISFWLLLYATRLKNTQPELCQLHKLLLTRRMWWEYAVPICLYRVPSPWLWMLVIKRHSYYWRCRTNNSWRSIDADFQDGVGSVSLSFLLQRQPMLCLWLCVICRPPDYPRHTTNYCWPSVDTHFQDVVGHVCLFILITTAANPSKVTCDVPVSTFYGYQ